MKQAQPSLLLFQHHFFHEIRTSEVNKHARYRLEIGLLQIWKSDQAFLVSETNLAHLRQLSLVFSKAILDDNLRQLVLIREDRVLLN